jgi:hypothetical protein
MFNIGDIVTIHDVEQQFDGLNARVIDYDRDMERTQVDIFDPMYESDDSTTEFNDDELELA